ncbi:hypothetical protein CTM83_04630 [Photobacterium leiognathi subsp. mandapamensis]|nr:hypothetical protein CTM83_04630 [Photobacterium leiognathi subsp. mandapamensis]
MNVDLMASTFLLYIALIFITKSLAFWAVVGKKSNQRVSIGKQYSFFSLFTVDYLLSSIFKERVDFYDVKDKNKYKSCLIVAFNYVNVAFSFVFLFFAYLSVSMNWFTETVAWLCTIRFISRCIEITVAFTRDVMTKPAKGKLTKYDRMQLALKSYIEVFVLGASIYILTIPSDSISFITAMNMSFGVGTFTNTSAAISSMGSQPLILLVYMQIFTTLTLVVMAFAIYIGRRK